MNKYSRRAFLYGTAGAVAFSVLPRTARADLNSQIRVAVVGVNGRGRNHLDGFRNQVVAVCDCDRSVLGREADAFEKKFGRKLDQLVDYRELVDRDDIDVISIATPNQTHALIAIAAAEAGKHVYCEKPVSQCVWEGRQVVNAARRYSRLIETGTQARSAKCIQEAVAFVRDGKLGPIQYALGTCYKARPSIGKLDKPLEISSSIDYDLWCGPAAKVDLYRPRFHYDWHWDFNTGNGDMGNQGVHQMDVARWFLGVSELAPRVVSFGGRFGYVDAGNTPNTQVTLLDYPDTPLIFETRGLPSSKAGQQSWDRSMDHYRGSQIGVIVQCAEGHVFVPNSYTEAFAYDKDGEQIQRWAGGGDHFANFLNAVRSETAANLNADILEGHLSSALCHMGGISYRLGETRTANEVVATASQHDLLRDSVERMLAHLRANEIDVDEPVVTVGEWLEMDPSTERFTNNQAANELVRRTDREPYIIPQIA